MTKQTFGETALGRRSFLRGAAFVAAAAPILTETHLALAAETKAPPSGMALHGQSPNVPPPGSVLINANENPLGPSKAALEAIARVAPLAGRYDLNGEEAQQRRAQCSGRVRRAGSKVNTHAYRTSRLPHSRTLTPRHHALT